MEDSGVGQVVVLAEADVDGHHQDRQAFLGHKVSHLLLKVALTTRPRIAVQLREDAMRLALRLLQHGLNFGQRKWRQVHRSLPSRQKLISGLAPRQVLVLFHHLVEVFSKAAGLVERPSGRRRRGTPFGVLAAKVVIERGRAPWLKTSKTGVRV